MSYKVTIQPSGHEFECAPQQNVLEAALKNGFAFPYGCRNGGCGACAGKVLEGQVAYLNGEPAFLASGDSRALFCQACPASDITIEVKEIGAAKDIQIKTLPAKVHHIKRVADDVIVLYLRLPATQRMPFLAGQYIDFILKNGKKRSFSIANAPHDDELIELHIRHVEGGYFTSFVFNELKENALLRIEGPLGSFSLNEDGEKPLIMVAGGTGFAPIKSLIEHMIHTQDPRPVTLFWGVKSLDGLYQSELVAQWEEQLPHFSYVPVLSEPKAEDDWQGATGFVHEMVINTYAELSEHEVYMCGPPAMIEAGREAFLARGLSEEALYCDSFEFAGD